jgi:hypothetical protein
MLLARLLHSGVQARAKLYNVIFTCQHMVLGAISEKQKEDLQRINDVLGGDELDEIAIAFRANLPVARVSELLNSCVGTDYSRREGHAGYIYKRTPQQPPSEYKGQSSAKELELVARKHELLQLLMGLGASHNVIMSVNAGEFDVARGYVKRELAAIKRQEELLKKKAAALGRLEALLGSGD